MSKKPTISANHLLRVDDEQVNIHAERMDEIAKLNKGGKLAIIKGIYQNLSNLATILDETRPDIAMAIDGMKSGFHVNLAKMVPDHLYAMFPNHVIGIRSSNEEVTHVRIDTGNALDDVKPAIVRRTAKGLVITKL